ncbi:MAG: hypothetical protein Q9171_004074 [Xanthocarpia ochracea]
MEEESGRCSSLTEVTSDGWTEGQYGRGCRKGLTAPEQYNEYYQAKFHTQSPGNDSLNDPTCNAFYSSLPPTSIGPEVETLIRSALCDLVRTYISGQAILIIHAIGSAHTIQASNACPSLVAAHIFLEGDQCPFQSYIKASEGIDDPIPYLFYGISNNPVTLETPITNPNQLTKVSVGEITYTDGLLSNFGCILQQNQQANRLINVGKVPLLFLIGEASVHALYDPCQVPFLRQAHGNVTFTELVDKRLEVWSFFDAGEEQRSDCTAGGKKRGKQNIAYDHPTPAPPSALMPPAIPSSPPAPSAPKPTKS